MSMKKDLKPRVHVRQFLRLNSLKGSWLVQTDKYLYYAAIFWHKMSISKNIIFHLVFHNSSIIFISYSYKSQNMYNFAIFWFIGIQVFLCFYLKADVCWNVFRSDYYFFQFRETFLTNLLWSFKFCQGGIFYFILITPLKKYDQKQFWQHTCEVSPEE